MLWTLIFWSLGISLGLSFCLFIYFKLNQRRGISYWKQRGIRIISPRSNRSLLEKLKAPFHELDVGIYEQMKLDGLAYGGRMEFGTPVLFVSDPDVIKNILVKDFEHFINRRSLKVGDSDPYFHKLLFNMENQEWKDMRVTMTPTFTLSKIRRMFTIFNDSAILMVNYLEAEVDRSAGEVNLQDVNGKYTLTVIATSAFGCESQAFTNSTSKFTQMSRRFTDALAVSKLVMLKFLLLLLFPKVFNFFRFQVFDAAAIEFFTTVIKKSIAERQCEASVADAEKFEKRDDFLQLMIDTKNGQLTMDEEEKEINNSKDPSVKITNLTDELILAQCILFFNAGFDTVESLLNFCLYELCLNPEVQEKLFEEVNSAMIKCGETLSHQIVTSLSYLDMVVSETLRKYPPAFHLERKCNLDYPVPNSEFVIEKGTVVIIPVLPIQHDAEYYSNPECFMPERFSAHARSKRHPALYLPFGLGQRSCIAKRFALAEAKVALAHVVHGFKFEPSSKTVIPMKYMKSISAMRPAHGMWLKVSKR